MIKKVINGDVHEVCKFFDTCPIASILCYKKNEDKVCVGSLINYSKYLREHMEETIRQLIEIEDKGKKKC